jgi:Cu(I)/Ag(I) efflux system membrane fusion protein/cobalt-zinc-cadmium efflux system membrane fusion protein
MKSETRLRDRGNGNYEGSSSLQSGGTWQVTITARRDGQVIATKQLSINASGGM